jgi:tRNA modification GTPase
MYDLTDTIAAVGSPGGGTRSIIRMTGPDTVDVCRQIFRPSPPRRVRPNGIFDGYVVVDKELTIEAYLYLFYSPHSYTGETVAELHLYAPEPVVEAIVQNLFAKGLRMAGPGEFTARAYLNGKMDLAQAEAVNEIISSSNSIQLAAAEKLLGGRLTDTAAQIRSRLIDVLSLLEAGLDFSGEDIKFAGQDKAAEILTEIKTHLEQLLNDSINYESVIDLPAVGIAGAPNAGKSSLLNAMLGSKRSIVSRQRKTTRDVLTSVMELEHCRCVLFDCAGLVKVPEDILDELAQRSAVEALRNSDLVLFCVDVSKADWYDDVSIPELIKSNAIIPVATKADLFSEESLSRRMSELNDLFGMDFVPVSARTGCGLSQLSERVDKVLLAERNVLAGFSHPPWRTQDVVALTARHRQAVAEAIDDLDHAIAEIKVGNDEIAAVFLRAASQAVSGIGRQNIDEEILDRIFSRFCVGK